jgi:signal transduction histidine kinase
VIQDVLEDLSPLAAQLGASIEVETLPEAHLQCSPGLLSIVFANVFENAIKYLAGREERRVRISACTEGSACRVAIEDTGPGIPAEAHQKIFEPFFRVAGAAAPGVGIGLATVHRILGAHGGHIAVESRVGQGSRFTIWLPLATAADTTRDRPEHGSSAAVH